MIKTFSSKNHCSHKVLLQDRPPFRQSQCAVRVILRPLVLLLGLALSACVTTYPDLSQARSPCRADPGGWCAFIREAAVDAFPYAIASTNAYVGDSDVFAIPDPVLQPLERLPIAPADESKGFSYQIFARFAPGTAGQANRDPIARVLAFRGTDFKDLTDIYYGTLRSDQIEMATRYFEAEQKRWGSDIPWIVTGHSLGGALATEVSMRHPEVRAYMFNTSTFGIDKADVNDVQRIVFNERGEMLRRFERYDVAPASEVFTINCGPDKNTFAKHKVRPLADCITWIAAYASRDAFEVMKANGITKPFVECGPEDKPHPGPGTKPDEPCVHNSLREPEGKRR